MKTKDIINLLNRAAAAIETPGDLTQDEKRDICEDLVIAAQKINAVGDCDECHKSPGEPHAVRCTRS